MTDRTVDELAMTPMDRLVQDFSMRGLVILPPESLGVEADLHGRVYATELAAHRAKQRISPGGVPEILEILAAPGLVAALDTLVGPDWAVVPFTHNASFTSGARDQHWHKDDNGPFNSRKQRHHQAVQVEMLYYPQDVRPDMGPTATVPYSQYWTFDHEENHDNFAGADHLDFNYQISGMEREPVSGPDSQYDPEDIRAARTDHDVRMREAVTNTGWPLVRQLEAAPLRAGSVVIYSHNTFHRGNHRRDDWRTWDDQPRFMWRFWLYRTRDPQAPAEMPAEPDWGTVDPLTGVDLTGAGDDLTTVWRYHDHWTRTGQPPAPRQVSDVGAEAARLFEQLLARGDAAEPLRVGAAYRLAALVQGDDARTDPALSHLARGLRVERESVRRAATYGLIAAGAASTETFLAATRSEAKWVRKAGVYGLGDAAPLTGPVLDAVVDRLGEDPSVYVRSVAAGSLGCLGRRAVATGVGAAHIPACVEALVASLAREENRPAMDRAQGRSIKFCRPTDESDVCEGGGIDLGLERLQPVRSAVRENVLWSLVILSAQGPAALGGALGPAIAALRGVVSTDVNLFCIGYALDALNRLAAAEGNDPVLVQLRADLPHLLREAPARPWESLVRGGRAAGGPAEFEGAP